MRQLPPMFPNGEKPVQMVSHKGDIWILTEAGRIWRIVENYATQIHEWHEVRP